MNKYRYRIMPQIIIIIAVLLIGACFAASMIVIDKYAKDDCFNSIEEATMQASYMFSNAIEENKTQLTLFADILAANAANPIDILHVYMDNFIKTQSFSAVCIHRADGINVSQGVHICENLDTLSFKTEIEKVPYISNVCANGDKRSEMYIYQAVPIIRDGEAVAILYGYVSLDKFPTFISSAAYDGKCELYIVDGNNGDFLMDEYHRLDDEGNEIILGNVFDGGMGEREAKSGYNMEEMRYNIRNGKTGYYVFKSKRTDNWYYTYYMPMGINNWSMQLTIDEPTAFAAYYNLKNTILFLMICVLIFALIIIFILMLTNSRVRRIDRENLKKSDYINDVQSALIGAHNNPDFVHQALKIIANESKAETVLLLTFNDKTISNAYYWPSKDRPAVMALMGLDISEVFPVEYDTLMSNDSVFVDEEFIEKNSSEEAKGILEALEVSNMLIVPIADNAGMLKAGIITVNTKKEANRPDMLKCLTRDFFMAITNLENYNIIKNMGAIDYLTGVKNRNSYEAEIKDFISMENNSLWCAYIDVNGLHETNNTQGHKAGDLMLVTVANVLKDVFGNMWVYRLGGDEFVVFATDSTHNDFINFKHRVMTELAQKGYYVSIGFEGTTKNDNNVFDVEKIVRNAEAIMYKEKKEYYAQNKLSTQRERLN